MADAELQIEDRIDPARIAALNAVLGLSGDRPHPFAHQVFFWDARPASALGVDGHPKVGGLIPDLGLPRRMWAGGSLEFHAALQPGVPALKTTRLVRAERKEGRSGPLGVVTLHHRITQEDELVVEDVQELIYRAAADPAAPAAVPPTARTDETRAREKSFTTTELFRYSALTFNGHRIHYDRDYAKSVEGYPGLVVHGPLLAQYLMLMAEEVVGRLRRFRFRATAPLFDFEAATFCACPGEEGLELWVRGPNGRQCMTALAE